MGFYLDKQEIESEYNIIGQSFERCLRGVRGNGIGEGDDGEETCN